MVKTVFWFDLADYAALSTAEAYPNGFVIYHTPNDTVSFCILMVP